MVHLQRFHERHEELFVYAISMHADAEEARQMTREIGVTYPVFDGAGSKLGEQYAYG